MRLRGFYVVFKYSFGTTSDEFVIESNTVKGDLISHSDIVAIKDKINSRYLTQSVLIYNIIEIKME